MSDFSKNEVKKIAKLANLTLKTDELEKFSKQLSETLNYVKRLKKLETKGVMPVFQTTGLKNVFREDKVRLSLTQGQALKNSSSTYKGYFKIRAIFKP